MHDLATVRSLFCASVMLVACSVGSPHGGQAHSDAGSARPDGGDAPEIEAGPNDVVGTVLAFDRAPFPGDDDR